MTESVKLSVSHTTTYRYSTPVETAQHLATIHPLECAWQSVVSHTVRIEPVPSYESARIDSFGNEVRYFTFDAPHDYLSVTSESTVVLSPRWQALDAEATPPWETVREALRYRALGAYLPETEFVFASPNIALAPELAAYALPSFAPGRPLVAAAIDLMHRIRMDFAYQPQATEFDTPALRAFDLRQGVCQDFAQVMIGCLRSLGLAARYVSGYLRTVPPRARRGSLAPMRRMPGPRCSVPAPDGSISTRPTTCSLTSIMSRWPSAATTATCRCCAASSSAAASIPSRWRCTSALNRDVTVIAAGHHGDL